MCAASPLRCGRLPRVFPHLPLTPRCNTGRSLQSWEPFSPSTRIIPQMRRASEALSFENRLSVGLSTLRGAYVPENAGFAYLITISYVQPSTLKCSHGNTVENSHCALSAFNPLT